MDSHAATVIPITMAVLFGTLAEPTLGNTGSAGSDLLGADRLLQPNLG